MHTYYFYLSENQLTGSIPTELGYLANLTFLYVNSNMLTGNIPTSLTNLTSLIYTDIGYNGLYTSDPTLQIFLDDNVPDWENTQTIAPENITAQPLSSTTIEVSWTPITYTADSGGYRLFYSTTPGGPYTLYGTTADKAVSEMEVSGLDSNTTYYFVVQTRTDPHAQNENTVDSEYSQEVSATTDMQYTITASAGPGGTISPSGAVTVDHGADQTGKRRCASGYLR